MIVSFFFLKKKLGSYISSHCTSVRNLGYYPVSPSFTRRRRRTKNHRMQTVVQSFHVHLGVAISQGSREQSRRLGEKSAVTKETGRRYHPETPSAGLEIVGTMGGEETKRKKSLLVLISSRLTLGSYYTAPIRREWKDLARFCGGGSV